MALERLQTRIRSAIATRASSEGFMRLRRRRAALARRLRGEPRVVHYFHQADDPYSHLVVQKLDALRAAYAVPFAIHLVSRPAPEFQGNEERFAAWAQRDAQSIAEAYGTTLTIERAPSAAALGSANETLAGVLDQPEFAKRAFELGETLWAGRTPAGLAYAAGENALREGDALRRRLRHYLGGTFHFDGEWFWGIDRIRSLERRLREVGIGDATAPLCVPEPTPTCATGLEAESVVLEYFPSLRSPYTAVGHAAVMDLVARSGVTMRLRPVMPMLMRGVPAPRDKQIYIITDAAREARERSVPFGRIVDPFGPPVIRAFALFPGAVALGRGAEFVTAYLSAAWAEGVDVATEVGLRVVAERAGLAWDELARRSAESDAEALLDENVADMLDAGLWGVPSFRVSGGGVEGDFACWGQDRVWRVEDEIARRAG